MKYSKLANGAKQYYHYLMQNYSHIDQYHRHDIVELLSFYQSNVECETETNQTELECSSNVIQGRVL